MAQASTIMPADENADEGEPKTLADAAYRSLRHDIITGRLAAGERLRVEHLRDAYGVGATPLREALSRLAAERLVVASGQRGFRVAPMSLAELDDVTETRVLLETRALEDSLARGDVAWEARLVAAHHTLQRYDGRLRADKSPANVVEWEGHNAAFHEALVGACRSPWLRALRDLLYDQHRRYRFLSAAQTHRGRGVSDEHRAIFEAAIARDVPRTVALSAEHIRGTARALRAALAKRLPQ
ncbi:MAG TPA: GntR family transcriptional regulator [Polyangiaceae bacterium]|nr:GntR family transcriptional regulator [Polyangiaceae bacterium]